MSRIGRYPIPVPSSVTVELGAEIVVRGAKGTLTLPANPLITIEQHDAEIVVSRTKETKSAKSLHGLIRTLLRNMIQGVTDGFERRLEMKGVGYRATKQGEGLVLNLGYSHPITVTPPDGIELAVEKMSIFVRGIDKQLVGQVAANIRSLRPPEPYKGKGIRYSDEKIRMKAGKAAKAAGAK